LPWTVNRPSPVVSFLISIPPLVIVSHRTTSLPCSRPGERVNQGPLPSTSVTTLLEIPRLNPLRRDATKIEIRTFHNVCFPRAISFTLLISLPAYSNHQLLPPLIPPLDEPSFSYSYPPIGSLNISAPSSAHFTSPESPDIHTYRAETRSLDFGSNDEESAHKPKRRRQQSLDTDDNSRKSRNPRKTAVACNFCRGSSIFIDPPFRACLIPFSRSQVTLQRHKAFLLQLYRPQV